MAGDYKSREGACTSIEGVRPYGAGDVYVRSKDSQLTPYTLRA